MNIRKVIAYKPIYFKITGSIEAALLLSQAEYIANKCQGKAFSRTSQEWEEETGLTYWKQQTARKILSKLPFWKEGLRGNPAKLFYKVDISELHNYLDNFISKMQNSETEYEVWDDFDDVNEGDSPKAFCDNSDIKNTSNRNNLELGRGNPNNLIEEKPRTIIGSIIEINTKNNNNTITEIDDFGLGDKSLHKKTARKIYSMKTNPETIEFYKTKITSTQLMEKFSSGYELYEEEFTRNTEYTSTSLSARLAQGKFTFEMIETQVKNSCSIGDMFTKLINQKYSVSDALKDLIFIYSDGLVSSWSRENKAIKSLQGSISDNLLTFEEIEDCLIWIKKTMNYSVSLSSIIPAMQYFRKYRRPIFGNRYYCDYSFRNNGKVSEVGVTPHKPTVSMPTADDMTNFFQNQSRRRG